MDKAKLFKAIEDGNALQINEVLDEALTNRAADYLLEKKKQVVAKMYPSKRLFEQKDDKTDFKAKRRKALRDKLKKKE